MLACWSQRLGEYGLRCFGNQNGKSNCTVRICLPRSRTTIGKRSAILWVQNIKTGGQMIARGFFNVYVTSFACFPTRIEASAPSTRTGEGRGHWAAKIAIKSTGEFADYIDTRVNSLDAPFEFEWQRGEWPWDWKLVTVRNSALEIPD